VFHNIAVFVLVVHSIYERKQAAFGLLNLAMYAFGVFVKNQVDVTAWIHI
jgi:hypothetical protein